MSWCATLRECCQSNSLTHLPTEDNQYHSLADMCVQLSLSHCLPDVQSLKFTHVFPSIGVFIGECKWGIQQEFPTNVLWVWAVLQRHIKDLFFFISRFKGFHAHRFPEEGRSSGNCSNTAVHLVASSEWNAATDWSVEMKFQYILQHLEKFPRQSTGENILSLFPLFFSFLPQATIFTFLTVTIFDLLLTKWGCEPNVAHFSACFFWNVCDTTSTFAAIASNSCRWWKYTSDRFSIHHSDSGWTMQN